MDNEQAMLFALGEAARLNIDLATQKLTGDDYSKKVKAVLKNADTFSALLLVQDGVTATDLRADDVQSDSLNEAQRKAQFVQKMYVEHMLDVLAKHAADNKYLVMAAGIRLEQIKYTVPQENQLDEIEQELTNLRDAALGENNYNAASIIVRLMAEQQEDEKATDDCFMRHIDPVIKRVLSKKDGITDDLKAIYETGAGVLTGQKARDRLLNDTVLRAINNAIERGELVGKGGTEGDSDNALDLTRYALPHLVSVSPHEAVNYIAENAFNALRLPAAPKYNPDAELKFFAGLAELIDHPAKRDEFIKKYVIKKDHVLANDVAVKAFVQGGAMLSDAEQSAKDIIEMANHAIGWASKSSSQQANLTEQVRIITLVSKVLGERKNDREKADFIEYHRILLRQALTHGDKITRTEAHKIFRSLVKARGWISPDQLRRQGLNPHQFVLTPVPVTVMFNFIHNWRNGASWLECFAYNRPVVALGKKLTTLGL